MAYIVENAKGLRITEDSEVYKLCTDGNLVVTDWIAKEKAGYEN